ncbi:EAL domain-containing protein [Ideonella paludis]|uniref:EAL domain-containing protein n=1 Tax=Ideonella paludis TaxID=1233411 RepID=UPI001B398A7D|nr:EAL domain-containing protein [Ideonella paludis]
MLSALKSRVAKVCEQCHFIKLILGWAARIGGEISGIVHSLKLACLSMVPFLVGAASVTLFESFTGNSILGPENPNLGGAIQGMFPLMLVVSIAYQLCGVQGINKNIGILLALVCSALSHMGGNFDFNRANLFSNDFGNLFDVLIIPILALRLFDGIARLSKKILGEKFEYVFLPQISEALRLIIPFICTLFLVLLIVRLSNFVFDQFGGLMVHAVGDLGGFKFMFVRMLAAHLIWTVGLHGDNLFGVIFGSAALFESVSGRLDFIGFYNIFVIFGGCGSALCLWLAVLLGSKDRYGRRVAILATPFILFNIPEILIFGLPVIMNRLLLVPFFLVPIANFAAGYLAIQSGLIEFPAPAPTWTTPVFLNIYLATDGNVFAVLVQFVSIATGTLIYMPFVRKFSYMQSSSGQLRRLERNLSLTSNLESINSRKFHKAQMTIIDSHMEVTKIIDLLEGRRLEVYYQPKVDPVSMTSSQFEALLRIHMSDGVVKGPFFLETLEMAGLASTIDLWVCRAVKQDIGKWREVNFEPRISINLHPDTISDRRYLDKIVDLLAGMPIDFEILERGSVNSEVAIENLHFLRDKGFKIALDDFGSGFAGLDALTRLPLDMVKIDKSLLDAAATDAGRVVYETALQICRRLGIDSVTEGVETRDQLQLAVAFGVTYVQGYLTGRPIPGIGLEYFAVPEALRADALGAGAQESTSKIIAKA